MKLNVVAFSVTCALIWGGAVFVVGIASLVWPHYGHAFLELVASIYPGYRPGPSFGSVGIGTVYGLFDGAIGGAVFAWLYNLLSRRFSSSAG
jgi:hypothetical protein